MIDPTVPADTPEGAKTPLPGEMIPQKHGGALRRGNPSPGRGPAMAKIRDACLQSFAKRLPILERIADGKLLTTVRVRWAEFAGKVKCADCESQNVVPIIGKHSGGVWALPTSQPIPPNDRMRALELIAKYGLDVRTQGVDVHDVRERVAKTLEVLRDHLPADKLDVIVQAIRPIWRAAA